VSNFRIFASASAAEGAEKIISSASVPVVASGADRQ
jgi:hypothetical protein